MCSVFLTWWIDHPYLVNWSFLPGELIISYLVNLSFLTWWIDHSLPGELILQHWEELCHQIWFAQMRLVITGITNIGKLSWRTLKTSSLKCIRDYFILKSSGLYLWEELFTVAASYMYGQKADVVEIGHQASFTLIRSNIFFISSSQCFNLVGLIHGGSLKKVCQT